jgi:chemotaxis protein CheD
VPPDAPPRAVGTPGANGIVRLSHPTPRMGIPVEDDVVRPPSYLHPGEMVIAAAPHSVTTVLGSCVAVCLWSARTGAGGINHFLLPSAEDVEGVAPLRFGNLAIGRMLDEFARLTGGLRHVEAKVFGGAQLLGGMGRAEHLGRKNVRVAFGLLRDAGIPVVAHDVLGSKARKLVFHTDTGVVWLRKI